MERVYTKNNIIIFGLAALEEIPVIKYVSLTFLRILKIDLTESDINNIFHIINQNKPSIKLELVRHLKKQSTLENYYKLKEQNASISFNLYFEAR